MLTSTLSTLVKKNSRR